MRWLFWPLASLMVGCGSADNGEVLFQPIEQSADGSGGKKGGSNNEPSSSGSSAGSTGGSTGVEPSAGGTVEECNCAPYEGCKAGQCVRMDYFYFSLRRVGTALETIACAYRKDVDAYTLLGEADGCQAFKATGADQLHRPPGTGRLAVGTATAGPWFAAEPSYFEDCFPVEAFATIPFNPGDVVTMAGEGGTRFPKFEVYLTAPAPLTNVVLPKQLTPGQDATATWQPGTGQAVGLVVDTGTEQDDIRIVCSDLADDGSATIPAALTQHLQNLSGADVYLSRSSSIHFTPAGWEVGIAVKTEYAQLWDNTPVN